MVATRAGPFLLGWIAVVMLSSHAYGAFVLAFAWVNAAVGVCFGLFPALASRSAEDKDRSDQSTADLIRLGMSLISGLALLAAVFGLLSDGSAYLAVAPALATGWSCLSLGCSCFLAILCWSLGLNKPLVGLTLLESFLHALWLMICGIFAWDVFVIMLGLGTISALISSGFLLILIQNDPSLLKAQSLTSDQAKPSKFASLFGPNLSNTLTMSATPALALTITSMRGPALNIEVLFGVGMLLLSAGLFPLQVLTLKQSQKLIRYRTASEKSDNQSLYGSEWAFICLALVWGIAFAGLVIWIGPLILSVSATPFNVLQPYLPHIAWIGAGWAFLAAAGPVLQAQYRYQTWSIINIAGCISLLVYAGFGPLSAGMLLIGTSLSVLVRCGFAATALSGRVKLKSQVES